MFEFFGEDSSILFVAFFLHNNNKGEILFLFIRKFPKVCFYFDFVCKYVNVCLVNVHFFSIMFLYWRVRIE